MASVVDVCNRALDKLGQDPITSLTQGNKAANICNRAWPIVREQELRRHIWNFAVARTVLAPSSVTPSWGFTYQHPLPSDCLRLIEIRDLKRADYQVEDNHILADDNALYIRYIKDVEDPNEFDALFVDMIAARMAFEMCEAFNQNNTKKQAAFDEWDLAITEAKMTDALENPPSEYEEDDWISVRY